MAATPSKLVSLVEAAQAVASGASLTAGGFAHSHQPLAFTRELIRQGRSRLTLMSVAECWVAEFLAAAGMLEKVYFSNFMFEGYGRCQRFSKAVEAGAVAVEDHSHFGMVSRLMAAGLGLPFMPMKAMAGTDILAISGFEPPDRKARRMQSPFGHEVVTAVSPLRPDVAVIHAARADRLGNVQLFGTTSVIEEQARAAGTVIVTVEEIVDTDIIRRQPEMTLLPALMVDMVVHLPYGAHPTGVYGYYDHDSAHLADYYAASRTEPDTAVWLDRWAHGLPDHFDYLDALGMTRLLQLRVDPALGYLREASHG
ncbi:3-oxoadipate--succinyl-CoA transferase subunit A [Alsobacter soli]|uniref:3-oxoadipate--succinyl-CoA transferase subunit A n=1 Tax=Alsobacter soli TaxID=2109933 RepID=A0A2T1HTC3_9HYPH|nr:CoA-transferase [Alsobacter soli]PSC04903.1 3-oxoadipate--succinyl-CoA transferase subunit A [Alsobacter soli]